MADEQSVLRDDDDLDPKQEKEPFELDDTDRKTQLKDYEKELKALLKKVQEEIGVEGEDFSSEEGKKKRKNAINKIGDAFNKISSVMGSSLTTRKKAERMQTLLKTLSILSLVPGVWGFIQNTWITKPEIGNLIPDIHIGGKVFLTAALVLFVLKVIHKILAKGGILLNDVFGFWKETKSDVRKKVKKDIDESFMSIEDYEAIKMLEEFEIDFGIEEK